MSQQPKLATLRVEHLHAGEVGTHDGHGGVENLFIQRLGIVLVNQLGADVLELPGGIKLRREASRFDATLPQRASSQCRSQAAGQW